MSSEKDFNDKYLNNNFIIRWLIKKFFRSIEKILSKTETAKILEVGCGSGFSTRYLSKMLKGKDFQASELDIDFVEKARKRNLGLEINQESIYALKRRSDEFDLVIVLEVLEHLENPELALKELHRITSRYCLLSVPREPLWRILNVCRLKYLRQLGNTPDHIQHWSKDKFIRFLKPYFNVKQIRMPLPWIVVLAEKKGVDKHLLIC